MRSVSKIHLARGQGEVPADWKADMSSGGCAGHISLDQVWVRFFMPGPDFHRRIDRFAQQFGIGQDEIGGGNGIGELADQEFRLVLHMGVEAIRLIHHGVGPMGG